MLVQGKFQQSKDFTFLYKIKGRLMCAFTLCLVRGIIGKMENNRWKMVWKTVFFTVWEAKENREDRKSGRKFSSRTHQFFSSQIGRKTVERKLLLTWNYTNVLSHLPSSQTQRLSWNQVKKKKPETESWRKKKRESTSWMREKKKEKKGEIKR